MPQPSKKEINPQDQLRWFLNKLILLSKKPVTLSIETFDESICFPAELLGKEGSGLFPIGSFDRSIGFRNEEHEYAYYCKEMLEKIKRDIYKLDGRGLHFSKENFSWHEDEGFFGYGYAFFIDCYNKPLFESYLRFMDTSKKEKRTDGIIEKIEILEDKNETGRINIYINGNYGVEPMNFSRNKSWGKMYELARSQEVSYEKSFYDYFNSQQTNPLYTNGFKVSKILKERDGYIVPNIEIKLITKSKITRQLKSA